MTVQRRRSRQRMHVAAAMATVAFAATAYGQTEWINPQGGSWFDPANWSPKNVPNSPGETAVIGLGGQFDVTVEGRGNLFVRTVSIVNPEARVILLGAGQGGRRLVISDPAETSLFNDGVIFVNDGAGSDEAFIICDSPVTTIDGAGSIVLNAPGSLSRARLDRGTGLPVINGPFHTIAGRGEIRAVLVNDGLVWADGSDAHITFTTTPKQNRSLYLASDGGTIELSTVSHTQSDGATIRADDGFVNLVGSVTIQGGALEATNGGVIFANGGEPRIMDCTMAGDFVIGGGFAAKLDGAIVNNGVIKIGNIEPPAGALRINRPALLLDGAGSIDLAAGIDDPSTAIIRARSVSADSLLHGRDHTIQGSGQIHVRVLNDGTLAPGYDDDMEPGAIQIVGPVGVTCGPDSAVNIDLAGTSANTFDRIEGIDNETSFHCDGLLVIEHMDGFRGLRHGQSVTIIEAGQVTGRFTSFAAPVLGGSRRYVLRYDAGRVRLAVPNPGVLDALPTGS